MGLEMTSQGLADDLVDASIPAVVDQPLELVEEVRWYERKRTTKALADLDKQIAGKRSKLGNEKFVANAKPEIVEAERKRLAELEVRQASLTAHLSELSS